MSVADVYLEILQPALYEIGRGWAVGDHDVAHEHSATAVTQSLLGTLGPRMRAAPTGGRLAIVTGSPEELHALGVQMVADFLEGDGWEVLNLGASTPAPDLARLADAERADVVALSTSTPAGLPGAAAAVAELRALEPRPLVVLGGQLWSGAARRRRGVARRRPRARRAARARRDAARALPAAAPRGRGALRLASISVRFPRRLIVLVASVVLVLVAVAGLLAREDEGLPGDLPAVPTPPEARSDRERTPLPDPFAYDPERAEEFERRAAAGTSHVLYARSPGGAGASALAGRALAPAGGGGREGGRRRPRPARGARVPRERGPRGRDGGRHRGRGRPHPDPRRDRPEPARHARRRRPAAAATRAASGARCCAGGCSRSSGCGARGRGSTSASTPRGRCRRPRAT